MSLRALALASALFLSPSLANADGFDSTVNDRLIVNSSRLARPDAHAPISIMGDHRHAAGETMISIRRMRMTMSGNKIGKNDVSDDAVLATPNNNGGMFATLQAVPRKMTMDMTMFGIMYAPNDTVTLAAMTNVISKEMIITSYNPSGVSLGDFRSRSEGLGDTSVTALIGLPDIWGGSLHAGFGLQLPTGSIKEKGIMKTPMNMWVTARLPYGMQLGSGTFDATPSLTFQKYKADLSFGAQLSAVIRLNENAQGYHLGHVYRFSAWSGKRLSASWSLSSHLNMTSTQNISGHDALIDKAVQAAQTAFYGGARATFGLGVNWIGSQGILRGHRLAAEISGPIYEDLNGPQMSQEWGLILGYQKSF